MAPSSLIVSPFIILFVMMCCTRWAYSSGFPSLLGLGTVLARKILTFSGREARSGVSKRPGAMVLTQIPWVLRSLARGSVMPTMAP